MKLRDFKRFQTLMLDSDFKKDYKLLVKQGKDMSLDALNDYLLLTMATERMGKFNIDDPATYITAEEMDRRLAITQEERDSVGEVEFE